jgi:hypothetical protein
MHLSITRRTAALAVVLCVFVLPVTTQAASISYGNFSGVNVNFNGVEESSLTDPVPLYDAPSVSGDSLLFSPLNFAAKASGGIDFTDGRLTTSIEAKPGRALSYISVYELGDYFLFGAGSTAQIAAPLFIRIDEIDGKAIGTPINYNTSLTFTGGGNYTVPGSGTWEGSAKVDLAAILACAGITKGSATKVQVTMDNSLLAFAPVNGLAFIKKKDIGDVALTIGTEPIPEPASLVLAALGFAALALRARRR